MIVTCPECGQQMRLKAEPAPGKRVKCPGCEAVFAPVDDTPPPRKNAVKSSARKPGRADDDDEDDDRDRPLRSKRRRDDEEDDDYDDRPARRRKKARAGIHPGLLWGLIGGGALLLAGGIVLVLLLVLGGSSHESALKEAIALMEEFAGILESVKDARSAKAATSRIDSVCDRLAALKKRADAMPDPSPEEKRRLMNQYEPKLAAAQLRVRRATEQAVRNCQADPSFIQSLNRFRNIRM
jgi:predicted Zn finger-like uncharacterized protein